MTRCKKDESWSHQNSRFFIIIKGVALSLNIWHSWKALKGLLQNIYLKLELLYHKHHYYVINVTHFSKNTEDYNLKEKTWKTCFLLKCIHTYIQQYIQFLGKLLERYNDAMKTTAWIDWSNTATLRSYFLGYQKQKLLSN